MTPTEARAWAERLEAAGEDRRARLMHALRREFAVLLTDIKAHPTADAARGIIDAHRARLNVAIASAKRATAATFGFLALEMCALAEAENDAAAKADGADTPKPPPTRAERVGAVLLDLASAGGATMAQARKIAALLADNRLLVSYVELMLLTSDNHDDAHAVAQYLLTDQRVAATVAVANADAHGVARRLEDVDRQLTTAARARRTGPGQVVKPPPPPPGHPPTPPGAGSGDSGGFRGGPPRTRFRELVRQLVEEEAPERARRIAATSGRIIASVLSEGVQRGWSHDQIAAELVRRIGPDVALYRARGIARMELGSAQSGATFAIARERASRGALLAKGWSTILDGHERQTHHDANGQVRGLDEMFDVGETQMRYPLDPEYGAMDEKWGCRCTMLIQSAPRRRQSAFTARAG